LTYFFCFQVSLKDDQDFKGNPTEYKIEVQKLERVDLGELRKCLEGKDMKWEYFDLGSYNVFFSKESVLYEKLTKFSLKSWDKRIKCAHSSHSINEIYSVR